MGEEYCIVFVPFGRHNSDCSYTQDHFSDSLCAFAWIHFSARCIEGADFKPRILFSRKKSFWKLYSFPIRVVLIFSPVGKIMGFHPGIDFSLLRQWFFLTHAPETKRNQTTIHRMLVVCVWKWPKAHTDFWGTVNELWRENKSKEEATCKLFCKGNNYCSFSCKQSSKQKLWLISSFRNIAIFFCFSVLLERYR